MKLRYNIGVLDAQALASIDTEVGFWPQPSTGYPCLCTRRDGDYTFDVYDWDNNFLGWENNPIGEDTDWQEFVLPDNAVKIGFKKFFGVAFYLEEGGKKKFLKGYQFNEINNTFGEEATVSVPKGANRMIVGYAESETIAEEDIYYLFYAYQPCHPLVKEDATIDYEQETEQAFYRGKYNGSLTFQKEDYDLILAQSFEEKVMLQVEAFLNGSWQRIFEGYFFRVDCTIDVDNHTIEVKPTAYDRYTDLLAHQDEEFNLVKLAPARTAIEVQKRPIVQVVNCGESKISCFLDNLMWEANAKNSTDNPRVLKEDGYQFSVLRSFMAVTLSHTSPNEWEGDGIYIGDIGKYQGRQNLGDQDDTDTWADLYNIERPEYRMKLCLKYMSDGLSYIYTYHYHNDTLLSYWYDAYNFVMNTPLEEVTFEFPDTTKEGIYLGTCIWNYKWTCLMYRMLVDKAESGTTYEIPSDDIAETNYNYRYCFGLGNELDNYFEMTTATTDVVTPYPASNGKYFVVNSRQIEPNYSCKPIYPDSWGRMAFWLWPNGTWYATQEAEWRTSAKIADCYNIVDALKAIIKQIDSSIKLEDTDTYSQFLSAMPTPMTSDNGFTLYITPKSNVINSYYSKSAQNAPISFKMVMDMLKNLYKLYWHIDAQNRLHIEHIQYYLNGLSYSDNSQTLVNLTTSIARPSGRSKCFGQTAYKYNRPAIPQQYTFGWMDAETLPFDGQKIDSISQYAEEGNIEDVSISNFSADLDYILTTPSDINSDGFALIACPIASNGLLPPTYNRTFATNVISVGAINEDCHEEIYNVQNGQCSMMYQHRFIWLHNVPSAVVRANGRVQVVQSISRGKEQSLKFTDLVMEALCTDLTKCDQLITTNLGNGSIKKIALNLNNLAVDATLLYDTKDINAPEPQPQPTPPEPPVIYKYINGKVNSGATFTFTFNGQSVTVEVEGGEWEYAYDESTPCTSLDFSGSSALTEVDFTDADDFSGLTSLASTFANCTNLEKITFTNGTLENVTTMASMCDGCTSLEQVIFGTADFGSVAYCNGIFDGCTSLDTITASASGTWQPDIDLSDCPLTYSTMSTLMDTLYSYLSGTHTITFNQSIVDALTSAQVDALNYTATNKSWSFNQPVVIYHIKGTSTANTETIYVNNIAHVVNVAAGAFDLIVNEAIEQLSFQQKQLIQPENTTLTSIDLSLAGDLLELTDISFIMYKCSKVISVTAPQTFENVIDAYCAFNLLNITPVPIDIDLPNATFSSVTDATSMFRNVNTSELSLPKATFASVQSAEFMFNNLKGELDLPKATFASVTNANDFISYATMDTLNLPLATFERATTISGGGSYTGAFSRLPNCTAISMPNATFSSVTNAFSAFIFDSVLQTLSLPKATFASVTKSEGIFSQLPQLRSIDISAFAMSNNTDNPQLFNTSTLLTDVIISTSNIYSKSLNINRPPLTYESMLNVANWLANVATSQTLTLNSTAWNSLSTAQQNEIDAIITAKNWTKTLS